MITDYRFTKQALKDLKKLPVVQQRRLIRKLDYFVKSGVVLSFAKPLTHSQLGEYRFRVGEYRIIFDVEPTFIKILTLGHRREIYK